MCVDRLERDQMVLVESTSTRNKCWVCKSNREHTLNTDGLSESCDTSAEGIDPASESRTHYCTFLRLPWMLPGSVFGGELPSILSSQARATVISHQTPQSLRGYPRLCLLKSPARVLSLTQSTSATSCTCRDLHCLNGPCISITLNWSALSQFSVSFHFCGASCLSTSRPLARRLSDTVSFS